MANVERLFLDDPYRLKQIATVTAINTQPNYWIQVDKTIFQPPHGNHPGDKGAVDSIAVDHLSYDKHHEINHYFTTPQAFKVGQQVTLTIDAEQRQSATRFHTANHLIIALVEKFFPQLKVSQQQLQQHYAWIEFTGSPLPTAPIVQQMLSSALEHAISQRLTVASDQDVLGKRIVSVKDYFSANCDSLHTRNLSELKGLLIRKIICRQQQIRIVYSLRV